MGIFRKQTPDSKVADALDVMFAESKVDAVERRGLTNRPRYVTAQAKIISLGSEAVDPLLARLAELQGAVGSTPEHDLASDIIELLGKIGDERAVPVLTQLLPGIWATVHHALAATPAGTRVLIEASQSGDPNLRRRAMGMWVSRQYPAEIVDGLCRGLRDADLGVRNEAISAVIARGKADHAIVEALKDLRATDPNERVRDRADNALSRFGIRVT